MSNPYESPETKSVTDRPDQKISIFGKLASVLCWILISLYGLLFVVSFHEIVNTGLQTDYVRHAVAAVVFLCVSFITTRVIRRGGQSWIPLFIFSGSLLIVLFLPGLNPVVNALEQFLTAFFESIAAVTSSQGSGFVSFRST